MRYLLRNISIYVGVILFILLISLMKPKSSTSVFYDSALLLYQDNMSARSLLVHVLQYLFLATIMTHY